MDKVVMWENGIVKKAASVLIVMVLALGMLQVVSAEGIGIKIGNRDLEFTDAFPFIDENGRTQVPLRALAEGLGATVDWNGETQTITLTRFDEEYVCGFRAVFVVGSAANTSSVLTLNNSVIEELIVDMDTAPVIIGERTYIPARYVAYSMGWLVSWNDAEKTVECFGIGTDLHGRVVTPERVNSVGNNSPEDLYRSDGPQASDVVEVGMLEGSKDAFYVNLVVDQVVHSGWGFSALPESFDVTLFKNGVDISTVQADVSNFSEGWGYALKFPFTDYTSGDVLELRIAGGKDIFQRVENYEGISDSDGIPLALEERETYIGEDYYMVLVGTQQKPYTVNALLHDISTYTLHLEDEDGNALTGVDVSLTAKATLKITTHISNMSGDIILDASTHQGPLLMAVGGYSPKHYSATDTIIFSDRARRITLVLLRK